jgi:hypothetical protein
MPSPTANQHSTKFTASPPGLVSMYFDCKSAPVWRMVARTLSSETRCVPSPRSASDVAAIALTAPKVFHWRAAYPCHCKSVNRIPDNFLPKTRGGLMMGELRDRRTTRLRLKEKISDGYLKTIGPPGWTRFISSGAHCRAGRAGAAPGEGKRAPKILRRKSPVTH